MIKLTTGNTVKVKYTTWNGQQEHIGKVISIDDKTFTAAGYNLKTFVLEMKTFHTEDVDVTRSKLVGDKSKLVDEYSAAASIELKIEMEYKEMKRRFEEKIKKAADKKEKIKEKNDVKIQKIHGINRTDINRIASALSAKTTPYFENEGKISVTENSRRFYDSDLRHAHMYSEYDYTAHIEGTEEDIKKDLERLWKKVPDNFNVEGYDVKVSHNIANDGHKIAFMISYYIESKNQSISTAKAEKIAKAIHQKMGR